jgi:hypothetical protein
MTLATDPQRWFDTTAYAADWGTRNADMLALFDGVVDNASTMSFSEYGCGPHAPFTAEVSKSSQRRVVRWDMKRWDEEVGTVDFNREIGVLAATNVCVLSGVAEYINDIEKVIGALSSYHQYLLMSYAVRSPLSSFEQFKALIEHRQSKNGWRSHLSLEELVNVLAKFGLIQAMSVWQGQVLVVLRFHDR